MSASPVSEQFRAQLRARLERIIVGSKPSEVIQAEKVLAQYVDQIRRARESLPRVEKGLPRDDVCPRCYYLHGRVVDLAPTQVDESPHSVRWKCGTCGYYEGRTGSSQGASPPEIV